MFLLTAFSILVSTSFAQTTQDISEMQKLVEQTQTYSTLDARIEFTSGYFLERPYLKNGPLGEGSVGKYDQDPLYRADGFDCTTYIETTMAAALARNFDAFLRHLNRIRYAQGVVRYTARNHFVEVDWNPNNIKAGYLIDVTAELESTPEDRLSDESHIAIARQTVSKRKWYADKNIQDLVLPGISSAVLQSRLSELQSEGLAFPDQESELPYLKKTYFLSSVQQIPSPAVVNLVRRISFAGEVREMVTHQLLLFRDQKGSVHIRQASSLSSTMKVIDQTLEEFNEYLQSIDSVLGINILKIVE